ncbi:hypothetical protein Z968_13000 [Clostridium novyi A str. 4552]|uniref:Wadjet protein JetD C-terminal domain-containing protein n=1 Tax=Clostridium novyi A str. 4552 TaxID=1444289 RepID=A0A0A0HXP8_CLONO|nr:Wadjet anti-phage system protein JetD domain-containing protein [Clostridium novyi]KGM92846.1 hypothetical protein Z968_13000 [Clostridium novyi A str. 4552]
MKKYKEKILNNLIDVYERSSLYKGTSLNERNISFKFTVKNIKDYFDEDNYLKKEEIEQSAKELEGLELIKIIWGKGYEDHLIKRVDLNVNRINEAYKLLKRKSKGNSEKECINLLKKYVEEGFVLGKFSREMINKLEEKASIKKYLDIENIEECKNILNALKNVISQQEEIFKRNFSIRIFNDSKRFEAIEGKVLRILKDFTSEETLTLEEFNIFNNPSYVYFKGNTRLKLKNKVLDIVDLKFGIGISSQDLNEIREVEINTSKIITIENLTTFNTFNEDDFVCIYLGGFHNNARRELLKRIKKDNGGKKFYHFGDIDCGGFKILKHLREKTSIDFIPYNMNLETLINGRSYCKELTQNDKRVLEEMLKEESFKEFYDVFEYMLKENIKLEQEHLCYE